MAGLSSPALLVPQKMVFVHSGAGRIMRVRLRPMSLAESGVSTGGSVFTRVSRREGMCGSSP